MILGNTKKRKIEDNNEKNKKKKTLKDKIEVKNLKI